MTNTPGSDRLSETLRIKDFLTIREAFVDVKPITLVIGPQANGKSVVAKVLYYFRILCGRVMPRSVQRFGTKRDLEVEACSFFESIFPRYAWSDQEFELTYTCGQVSLVLRHKPGGGRHSLVLEYPKQLGDLYTKAKLALKTRLRGLTSANPEMADLEPYQRFELFWEIETELFLNGPLSQLFRGATFIPASRSFFATLQKNVFSFLASNIAIDPLIKEFGSVYEQNKRMYRRTPAMRKTSAEVTRRIEAVRSEVEKVLVGRYVVEDDQDWIMSDGRRVNLSNASSGQQESLPMLIVLAGRLGIRSSREVFSRYFVEEPEAHLFPVSQRRLVSIFSSLYANFHTEFFLTTHSPYILTAINNLILAADLQASQSRGTQSKVAKIIQGASPITFEDVSAYTMEGGALKSIVDVEGRLIGASIIDSVSDEFEKVFNELLSLTEASST